MVPPEPKSTVAWALSPAPVTSTTVPSPNASWLTRSPTSTEMTARLPDAAAQPAGGQAGRRDPRLRRADSRWTRGRRLECAPSARCRRASRRGTGTAGCRTAGPRLVRTVRPGEVQPLLGPGDADVGQPALLLQLARVAERAQVREDAVLQAGQEDDRELQALGGVQRHQRDHAGVVAGDRDLVGVGHQRDLLEEVGDRAARGWPPRTRAATEISSSGSRRRPSSCGSVLACSSAR